jgi:hypothetical protein
MTVEFHQESLQNALKVKEESFHAAESDTTAQVNYLFDAGGQARPGKLCRASFPSRSDIYGVDRRKSSRISVCY